MTFDGFPKALPSFLADLKSNNTRDWFEAHRGDYEDLFLIPAKVFVTAMSERLDKLYPGLNAVPKINGSIRRLNRDTRFGKDKSLYHDYLHLIFWKGTKATTAPGFHLVISAGHTGFGTGMWIFSDTELAQYRQKVMQPAVAKDLREMIAQARQVPGQELDEPALKRVPKGFDDASDPDLLRHKGIVVRGDLMDPSPLFTANATDFAMDLFRTQTPLLRWLDEHVAQS